MICSTPAFVLKTFDFRETSKIAVFFSRDFGKVKGILKGIRRDPRKFSSSLPGLSLNHIVFYRKRFSEIHLVSQCDLLEDFGFRGADLRTFGICAHTAEIIDALIPLEDASPRIFELLLAFLGSLKNEGRDLRPLFQIKILGLSGFKPHLDSCVVCDARIDWKASFSHLKGGLLCPGCLYHDPAAEVIHQGTIATIAYVEKSCWQNCLRINMMPMVKKQLEKILADFFHFHVAAALKTAKPVHELLDL